METLSSTLKSNPIVYVTRDIERALGLPLDTSGYFIISNSTSFAKRIANGRTNVLLIEETEVLDTREILENKLAQNFIKENSIKNILVFKNTSQIETICKKHDWKLLNPSAALASKVEEKISQIEWLGELTKYLPPHRIAICKEIKWDNLPFILQFNRAHTGQGTFFIQTETDLKLIQEKFPERPVRVTDYIKGPMFTNNNVVTKEKILIGNINYQITGLTPFTDQPFSTIGNDWSLPDKLLSPDQKKQYCDIATAVGLRLMASGWKGLFGIDVVLDEDTDKLYLIEINARQPASTTYESMLQEAKNKEQWNNGTMEPSTTFEAHLTALLDLDLDFDLIAIDTGAQIILRVQSSESTTALQQDPTHGEKIQRDVIERLQSLKFDTIEYTNTAPGSDLLRIQSKNGIMEGHNKFNEIGKKIIGSLI